MSSSYAPYVGGVETHVRQLADRLEGRGYPVTVWTVDRGEGLGVRTVDGIRTRYLPAPLPARDLRSAAGAALATAPAVTAWWRALRADRPDLLNVQCFGPNGVYGSALGRLARRPVVVSAHGETFMDADEIFSRSALLRSALRRSIAGSAAVTACSDAVAQDLRDRFGGTAIQIIPNGIELPATIAARGPADGDRTILAVGRAEYVKGFDLLLQAFARLPDRRGVRLVVAGDGGFLTGLRTMASDLGVAESVHFPGVLDPDEVAAAMATATLLAVPSRREAFGIVILEGWRAGVPLVVTDRDGPGDLVTDDVDGLTVDPTDTEALANALQRLLDSPGLRSRLADGGHRRVRQFDWDVVVEKYLELYERVLRG